MTLRLLLVILSSLIASSAFATSLEPLSSVVSDPMSVPNAGVRLGVILGGIVLALAVGRHRPT